MGVALDLWRERKRAEWYNKGIEEGRRLEREAQRKSRADDKPRAEGDNNNGKQ